MHREFWKFHPALLAAISFLIGIGFALFGLSVWFALIWLFYVAFLRKWAAFLLVPVAAAYAWFLFGDLPEDPHFSCSGRFSIASVTPHQTPFHRNLLYRGTLFLDGKAIPCSFATREYGKRPKAHQDYRATGILERRGPFDYTFKAKDLTPIPGSWSLAELRHAWKERFRKFLLQQMERPRTALLVHSLVTGEVEDRQLRFEFSRLGLTHLLAISGFHFGVLLSFLTPFLSFFLPTRWKWSVLLLLVTAYFLWIGAQPAVQRAWIAVTVAMFGKMLKRRAEPLNLLGAALFLELVWNPLAASNLGFQLSFASTFGILLLYESIEKWLQKWAPARSLQESNELTKGQQIVYLLSSLTRKGLAISLAVNGAIFPLLLFHFGKFPLLSLVYNLFFPHLIAIGLLGLLAALPLAFLCAPIGSGIFACLDWFFAELLDLVSFPPMPLDLSIHASEFSWQWLPIYLAAFFLISLHAKNPACAKLPSPKIKKDR